MALTKTVNIDGMDVTFRASAAIPRIYRNRFHRDIYKDLSDLQKSIGEGDSAASTLDSFSLELFEDISYIMFFSDLENILFSSLSLTNSSVHRRSAA